MHMRIESSCCALLSFLIEVHSSTRAFLLRGEAAAAAVAAVAAAGDIGFSDRVARAGEEAGDDAAAPFAPSPATAAPSSISIRSWSFDSVAPSDDFLSSDDEVAFFRRASPAAAAAASRSAFAAALAAAASLSSSAEGFGRFRLSDKQTDNRARAERPRVSGDGSRHQLIQGAHFALPSALLRRSLV